MDAVIERLAAFITQNTPSWRALLRGGPPGLAGAFAALWFAGWLQRRGARTGYTRKAFHFLIFTTVAVLEWRLRPPAVCLFGAACSVAVFAAVWRGPGSLLYVEAASPHGWDNLTMQVVLSAPAWAWL